MTRTDDCLSTTGPAARRLAMNVGMTGDGPLSEELNDDKQSVNWRERGCS